VDQNDRYQKLASQIEKLGKKITVLAKNSYTWSKRASSDDITKKTKPNKNKNNEPRKKEDKKVTPNMNASLLRLTRSTNLLNMN